MKILFLGCNGYLGKHLCQYMAGLGNDVYGADIADSTDLTFLTSYIKVDVANSNCFKVIDLNVDFIFFFSAITGTIAAYDSFEKYIDVNEKGILNLLNSIRSTNFRPQIIFPSTRLVYKGKTGTPLPEDAEKEFKTLYALNKWTGEQLLEQYSKYFNVPYTVFRICVPYGNSFGNAYSYGTIGFFIQSAISNKAINLYGDGSYMRTFTHVDDICSQIYRSLSKKCAVNEIFNIDGETFSLKDVAMHISGKYEAEIKFVEWPESEKYIETGDTIFESSKIKRLLDGNSITNTLVEWISKL